jgi:hypothetical protein
MKTQLIMMGICLVIGGYIGWSLKPIPKCPEPSTTVEYIEVPVTKDSLIYKPVIIPKPQKVNVDSIYQVAKKYWQQFYNNNTPVDFVAKVDSNLTTEDSVLTGSIAFVSRIPIDPVGYFKTDLKVKQKIVTNTIVETEQVGFWYKRFVASLGFAIMYNIDKKTLGVGPVLSFGIRLN